MESSRGCVYGRRKRTRAPDSDSTKKDRRRSIRPDFQSSPKCAQAGCFTRIIHSFIGHTLTCSLCEKRRERFPREVTFALLRQALGRVRVSVRQRARPDRGLVATVSSVLQRFRISYPCVLLIPHSLHRSVIATCPVFVAKCAVLANAAR